MQSDDEKTADPKLAELWSTMLEAQKAIRQHMQAAGGDIYTKTTILANGLLCGDHLTYRGSRAPKNGCARCLEVYKDRQRRDAAAQT